MRRILLAFFVFLFGGSFVVFSCRGRQEPRLRVVRDIPDLKDGKSDMLTALTHSRSALGLDALENGFDSLQIRFWFTSAKDSFQILSIKRNNGICQSSFCKTSYKINYSDSTVRYYNTSFEVVSNKVEWGKFLDTLAMLDFFSLPDMDRIKEYPEPFDGAGLITIEISSRNLYRQFTYLMPCRYKDYTRQGAEMCSVIDFIVRCFEVRVFPY